MRLPHFLKVVIVYKLLDIKFQFIELLWMVLRTIASPGGKLSRQSRD